MTSRRPYWCPKKITRRPFLCFKQVLWTNLKPPVPCASAQGDKIEPIFRPLYKSLPNLQTQCQSISDWNFTEFGDTHKAAEYFNLREETTGSLQWSCYSWTKIFETSVDHWSAIRCLFLQCQSITPNSAILTKRLKILIFVKKLRVHCNDPVIHEQRFLKLPLN